MIKLELEGNSGECLSHSILREHPPTVLFPWAEVKAWDLLTLGEARPGLVFKGSLWDFVNARVVTDYTGKRCAHHGFPLGSCKNPVVLPPESGMDV